MRPWHSDIWTFAAPMQTPRPSLFGQHWHNTGGGGREVPFSLGNYMAFTITVAFLLYTEKFMLNSYK